MTPRARHNGDRDAQANRGPHGDLDDSLQAFMALVPRLMASLAERTGMSRSEIEALQHLAVQPLGPSDLATRLGVTPSAATLVIDRLAQKGHVARRRDPVDGRRVQVMPSDSAIEEVVGHLMPMLEGLQDAEAHFTAAERATILRYLELAQGAVLRVVNAPPDGESPA